MKNSKLLFIALLLAVSQGIFAQMTITGKVINAEDGLGLPGVNVVVKGTITIGTTTDTNGNFMLNVPNDATLQVSFIGYKTVELPVENQTSFNITLQTDANVLGDVVVSATRVIPPERAVVTAMGIVRDKIQLTYSIQSISGVELVRSPVPEDKWWFNLNGRISGLSIVGGSIRMRGVRSLSMEPNANSMLIVVDGVPMGRSFNLGMINSEMIEEVTILKSANAAMLYGSDAYNGAIVITLKK